MRISTKERWYDYKSKEEFEKHREEMKERGWCLDEHYPLGDMDDTYKYKYTAHYITGILYNGVNGR